MTAKATTVHDVPTTAMKLQKPETTIQIQCITMNHRPVIKKGKTSAGHKKLTYVKKSYSNLLA